MADIAMINNIKGKLIPSHNRDDEDAVFDSDDELNSAQNDVLEQFRIPAHTELEEDILTPSKLSKVQFNESTPRGFSFKQVEAYHTSVTKSVKRYIDLLERRDKDVHKLATEVDKYRTDVQNVRFQLELLQGSGQALVNEDGEYLKESDFSADQLKVVELENDLANKEDELRFLRKRNAELERDLKQASTQPAPVVALPGATPTNADLAELTELRQRQVELDAWEQDVIVEYTRMENEYNNAAAQVTDLTGQVASLTNQVASLTAQLDSANKTIGDLEAKGVDESVLNELRNELSAVVAKRDEFENAFNEYEASYNQLFSAYETLEASYKELEAKEPEESDELIQVRAKVEDLDAHIVSLNEHIDALTAHIEELESQQPTDTTTSIPGYKLPAGVRPEDLGL